MPTLSSFTSSLVLSSSGLTLRELDTRYYDSAVSTFVPVPYQQNGFIVPFEIRIQPRRGAATSNVYPEGTALAILTFVDGEYAALRFVECGDKGVKICGWGFRAGSGISSDICPSIVKKLME
jgi:hypothetical protein